MLNQYLFRMLEPEDWVRHYDEGTQDVNDFILPYGPHGKEISDTVYHVGADVPYHEHRSGFETFFVPRGRVRCWVRGQQFEMGPGDLLHLQPYTGHGFEHLEEGTIWRELFQDIYMADAIYTKGIIRDNFPTRMDDDPNFRAHVRSANDMIRREPAEPHVVCDPSQVRELRTHDFALATYHFDGIELKLKVGRWECAGVKEVWLYTMDKGFYAEWANPMKYYNTFYVAKGRAKFTVMGEEFEAGEHCLVHIPPYHIHKVEILADGTEIYDMNTEAYLLSLLEDHESVKARTPELLEDPAYVTALKERFGCYMTAMGKKN